MQQFFLFSLHTRCKQVVKNFRFFLKNGFQPYLLVVRSNVFFFSDGLNKFPHDFVETYSPSNLVSQTRHMSLQDCSFFSGGGVLVSHFSSP